MQEFLVLNLINSESFSKILAEVAIKTKFRVIEESEDFENVNLVLTDINHLDLFDDQNSLTIMGVTSASSDIKTFYSKNIYHTIPQDITISQLESLFHQQFVLKSFQLLKQTFNKSSTYSFEDFIYYADSVFMYSSMGIAFVTKNLKFLLFNNFFSTFFKNIYNVTPIIKEPVNLQMNKKDSELWEEITNQGSSFEGLAIEVSGKLVDITKHYNIQIEPIHKLSTLIGYSIVIEDISKFANANADLKKYYKYLLEQNSRLEKAYKEVELNNEKLKIAYEKVNALSNRDYLTKAPNRKFFLEKIEYEQLRFKRTNTPFMVAYGDIDNFKMVNDIYGHETGDYILISLTNLIKNTIRNIDFFCRWGGEEFLVFLAETDPKTGTMIVNRILKEIRNFEFNYNGNIIKITMTFGLAVYDRDQHINQIIDLADKRLYWGKKNNKDQVVDFVEDE